MCVHDAHGGAGRRPARHTARPAAPAPAPAGGTLPAGRTRTPCASTHLLGHRQEQELQVLSLGVHAAHRPAGGGHHLSRAAARRAAANQGARGRAAAGGAAGRVDAVAILRVVRGQLAVVRVVGGGGGGSQGRSVCRGAQVAPCQRVRRRPGGCAAQQDGRPRRLMLCLRAACCGASGLLPAAGARPSARMRRQRTSELGLACPSIFPPACPAA